MNRQTTNKYDSEFCGNLPIHLINVIQPYGALVVVNRKDGRIMQVSENCAELFGRSLDHVIEAKFDDFITAVDLSRDKLNLPQPITVNSKNYLGIFHEYPDWFILEINLHAENEQIASTFINVYHDLKEAMAAVENTGSLNDMLDVAARELKKASGFDKVMIYQFDENWNGHVLAEEREPDMESYFGVTFPASDIPKQARDLYLKNPYRFIPDRNYAPVKMFPVINPTTNSFLDMSHCNVRGVSTVHLEYLKNMNVVASMSTRIIKDGKLWGLIACHHKTPMQMNYKMCTVFELLSGIISARTSTLQAKQNHEFDNSLRGIYTSLVEDTYRSSDLIKSLLQENGDILSLFGAQGAAISYDGAISKKGRVPDNNDIEDIILWLNSKYDGKIYYTNSLPHEYDYAVEFKDVASGILAIPVDENRDEYILLFRQEVIRVINWGGDPETRINFNDDMKTYHPRHSFKVWQEKVTGVALPWRDAELNMAENLKDFVKAFLNGKDYSYKN